MEVKLQACYNLINPTFIFTYFLVAVLYAGYLCYYTALSQFECSPSSCLAPQNHYEEKHEKFITRRINNKLPSFFSFDSVTVDLWKAGESIFFHLGVPGF